MMIAIIIFYNIATGGQARLAFSKELKHCNVITFDGRDWLHLDFDRTGFVMQKVNATSGDKLIHHLRIVPEISCIISLEIKEKVKKIWTPWLVRSCNEICRYTTGVDIGFTFNPRHLLSKLLKYDGKRNYQVLSAWRREHGFLRGRQ